MILARWILWCLLLAAAGSPSDDAIRRQLEDILSRPEFAPRRSFVPQWLLDFMQWLGTLHETAPVLYWLLLIGLVLLLMLLLAHLAYTIYRVFTVSRRYGREESPEAIRQRLSAEYLAEARRRAEQADYTEAIRYLFLSLVHHFDESGRVGLRQDLTNREYLALFADRPTVQDQLRVFVDTLDENWYGQHPTARNQYEDCWQLFGGLTGARTAVVAG